MEQSKNKINPRSVGLGLRSQHFNSILKTENENLWFEVLVDNFLVKNQSQEYFLEQVCERFPVVFHGVGLSLASPEPLKKDYLLRVKELIKKFQPQWHSDHLCWSQNKGHYFHDLLPFPYTEEALKVVSRNIKEATEELEIEILVENVSSYLRFKDSQMTEIDFLKSLCHLNGCSVLFDCNNLYVNSINHNLSLDEEMLKVFELPIGQIHLAGHKKFEDYCLDDHGSEISTQVLDIYQDLINRKGPIPTIIEWDNKIPSFEKLLSERDKVSLSL